MPMARPKDFIKYIISEPEIAVGHWPFSDQFQDLAEQKWFARTNLLYISSGEVINIFLLLVNGRPISNPYFKLCHFAKNHVLYNNILFHEDTQTMWSIWELDWWGSSLRKAKITIQDSTAHIIMDT